MNPEPIWDWPSSVQFLGRYRVEGESSKFRNSVGYITAMNALQCNAMATDAIMAKHNPTSMGRPTKPIELSAEERGKLQEWARRPKTAERLALRSRIVLGCADGLENRQVARQLHVTDQTVCKWRERFRTARLEGLVDEPRPGAPRKITDAQVEALITRTLETAPEQNTHWSTRTMAKATGMSPSAVSRLWRAFALQPYRTETFKLSSDPFFIEKGMARTRCPK